MNDQPSSTPPPAATSAEITALLQEIQRLRADVTVLQAQVRHDLPATSANVTIDGTNTGQTVGVNYGEMHQTTVHTAYFGATPVPGADKKLLWVASFLWLEDCIRFCDATLPTTDAASGLSAVQHAASNQQAPILLQVTYQCLANSLIRSLERLRVPTEPDARLVDQVTFALAGEMLWSLITEPTLTPYAWAGLLRLLASPQLATLVEQHYHATALPRLQALPVLTSPEVTTLVAQYQAAVIQRLQARAKTSLTLAEARVQFECELADPRYRLGIRHLLQHMREGPGAAYLNHAFRQRYADAPTERWLTWALLFVAGGVTGVTGAVIVSRARVLVQAITDIPLPALPTPQPTGRSDRRTHVVATAAGAVAIPVRVSEWRDELAHLTLVFGRTDEQPAPYWCYVPGGRYWIGGWEPNTPGAWVTLRAFWVGRFPITRKQYQGFIEADGYYTRDYWTPDGWQWRQKYSRVRPWSWDDERFKRDWQPVIGINWYEATAFCTWLEHHSGNQVPEGYMVRLPTEAEWEVAAAYDAVGTRHTYPWGEQPPTPERAVYDRKFEQGPADIGSCPAGAAACGALDMGGQVWECCRSSYQAYPQGAHAAEKDFTDDVWDVPLRGGGWYSDRTNVCCGARNWDLPDFWNNVTNGFRLLLSPRVRT